MIAHLFTENTLLETAFSNIFKELEWPSVNHNKDAFCTFEFEADDGQIALLSAPFSPDLGPKIRQQLAKNPNLIIVLFLDTKYSSDVGEILDLIGAVVPSSASKDEIKHVLNLAAEGYFVLPMQYQNEANATAQDDAQARDAAVQDAGNAPLTARELQILQEITNGNANKQIARRLDISLNTVQVHNSSIFRKLGVDNRTQAAHNFHRDKMYLLLRAQKEIRRKSSLILK